MRVRLVGMLLAVVIRRGEGLVSGDFGFICNGDIFIKRIDSHIRCFP